MKIINCSFLNFKQYDLNHIIRIGSIRDGGYYVTKRMVEESSFLISGGISYNARFERDFKEVNPKCKIIMIDGSFNLISYLLRPFYWFYFKKSYKKNISSLIDMIILKSESIFLKKYLGVKSGVTIDSVFENYNLKGKGYLKLDIEGAEYEILDEISLLQKRFYGIAIEFHQVPNNIDLINTFISRVDKCVIGFSINETGGVDENNIPNTIELCFADTEFVKENNYDYHSGKIFSNEIGHELMIASDIQIFNNCDDV